MTAEYVSCRSNISVSSRVIIAQLAHQQGYIQVVMKQTGHHHLRSIFSDLFLLLPGSINVAYPSEVIVRQRVTYSVEVCQQWVCFVYGPCILFREKARL